MPVKPRDPQQNEHRWWGTLVGDGTKTTEGITLKLNEECIFFKTTAESHFIVHDTCIKSVRLLSISGDVEEALGNLDPELSTIIPLIKADLKENPKMPTGIPIVEIVEIDWIETSPLTRELIARTHDLFWNDVWLEVNKAKVKKGNVIAGRNIKYKTSDSFLVSQN